MALPGPSTQKAHMDKKILLAQMRLLSALESWALSAERTFPDYLHDDLRSMVKWLEEQILKDPTA